MKIQNLGGSSLTELRVYYMIIINRRNSGGDWRLVALLVFKTSVGSIRSRVGSIPIRLRHFLLQNINFLLPKKEK